MFTGGKEKGRKGNRKRVGIERKWDSNNEQKGMAWRIWWAKNEKKGLTKRRGEMILKGIIYGKWYILCKR